MLVNWLILSPPSSAPQTQCPPLPAILNGFITYAPDNTPDYDLGTVATYACDIGFVLDLSLGGSEIKTCADNNRLDTIGVFDNLNQTPRCTRELDISYKIYPILQCTLSY